MNSVKTNEIEEREIFENNSVLTKEDLIDVLNLNLHKWYEEIVNADTMQSLDSYLTIVTKLDKFISKVKKMEFPDLRYNSDLWRYGWECNRASVKLTLEHVDNFYIGDNGEIDLAVIDTNYVMVEEKL